jgi:hypothetical protein
MLIDGISDAELAHIFERLRSGGEMDLQTKDGRMVHIEVDRIDPAGVQEHDWV